MNGNSALSYAVETVVAVTDRNQSRTPSPGPAPQRSVGIPYDRRPTLTLVLELFLIVALSYGPLLLSISS